MTSSPKDDPMHTQHHKRNLTAVVLTLAALAAAIALSVGGTSAHGDSPTASAASKPTLTVGQQQSGIVSLIKDSGALKGAPYNVKFAVFPFGPPLVQAAAAGQIDLGDVGDVPPINGAVKDPGFKVIGAELPPSFKQFGDYLIVPKGSKIKTLRDLKGKSVAVPVGSSAHGFLLNAVQSVGLSPQTVKFVNLTPAALQAAFNSGQVDAASIWNPQATLDIEQGARLLLGGRPPLDPDVGFYVGADKDLNNPARRKLLTDLLERLGRAYQWGDAHPAQWIKDVQKETGIDAKTATIQVDNGKIEVRFVTPAIVASEQKLADTFLKAKQITAPVTVSKIVDNVLPRSFDGK
jgi:sulfonate transport system substrate-binding protein